MRGGAKGEAEERSEPVERPVKTVPGVGAVGGTGEAPSEQTAALAPQVPKEVPAPGASVEQRQDWFRLVLQQFEESEADVVWKQRR